MRPVPFQEVEQGHSHLRVYRRVNERRGGLEFSSLLLFMVKMSQNDSSILVKTRLSLFALRAAMEKRNETSMLHSPEVKNSRTFSAYSHVEEYFTSVEDAESIVNRLSDEYYHNKECATEIIAKMRTTKQRFAICYYLLGMSLYDTAYEIGRSYRQALRIRASIEGGCDNEDTHEKAPIS